MQNLVSVIIPSYNVAPYLRQCIDSVIAQTYTDIEIIIVNDGSTDITGDIIAAYEKKDSRVKSIFKKNGGLSSARNAGLAVAKGAYLIIFDADDVMVHTKVAQQVSWLTDHADTAIVHSDLIHFYDDTHKMYHLSMRALGDDQYAMLLQGNCINPNTVCMKRSVYETIGAFDEELRSAEDWDYWLRVCHAGIVIGYQPDILTLYRMRRDSLSADRITMCQTALEVLQKQLHINTDKHTVLLGSEISVWKSKLRLAHIQKKLVTASGLKRLEYIFISKCTRLFRSAKLWWRLKKYTNPDMKKYLDTYDKYPPNN